MKTINTSEMGARIRALREKWNFTQDHLAREAGISLIYEQALEYGRRQGSASTIAALAKALKTTPAYLMYGNESQDIFADLEYLTPANLAKLPLDIQYSLATLVKGFLEALPAPQTEEEQELTAEERGDLEAVMQDLKARQPRRNPGPQTNSAKPQTLPIK